MSTHLRVVSNSEIESFRRCPRLHWYRYVLLRRPLVSAEALLLGTLIHVGLEAWFGAIRDASEVSPLDWALAAIQRVVGYRRIDPLLGVQAEELMLGYHCRWIDAPISVIAVERQFECDVVDPIFGDSVDVRLGGKIDLVIRDAEDREMLGEHKSTSFDLEPGSMFWEKTKLSSQLGLYWVGARSVGFDPKGCLYDVIGKPKDAEPQRFTPPEKRKYRKDGGLYKGMSDRDEEPEAYRERLRSLIVADPGRFYARQVVVRLRSEVEDAIADLAATVELMRFAAERGVYPRNVDSCFLFNRPCDYFKVCTGEGSIEDDRVFRTAPTAHEELA